MRAGLAALSLLILLAVPAFGQTQQAQLWSPGALPDEFFGISYAFKRFAERVVLFFTFNNAEMLSLRTDFAERRLAEGILMAQKGDSNTAENLLEEYKTEMARVLDDTQILLASRRGDPKVADLVAKVADATTRHLAVLQEVLSTVPEQVKPAIQQAIPVSKRGSDIFRAALQSIPLQEIHAPPPVRDPAPIRRGRKN